MALQSLKDPLKTSFMLVRLSDIFQRGLNVKAINNSISMRNSNRARTKVALLGLPVAIPLTFKVCVLSN